MWAVLPTLTNRMVLIATAAVALVGAIDAAAGGSWDLVVLFGLVIVFQVGLQARLSARRLDLRVRADLVRWLRDRSEQSGEPVDHVADRAISAYRADLLGSRDA